MEYPSAHIPQQVHDSVRWYPPYALFHNKIGKLTWTGLNQEQISAYAQITIYFQQDRTAPKFVQYHITNPSGKTYYFTVASGKAFIFSGDGDYHQIRQIRPDSLQWEINKLPQIVSLKNFSK